MWLTLCRPSEAVEAQWSEFDLEKVLWKIPAERMKKRKEHTNPLPQQAVEMLRGLPKNTPMSFRTETSVLMPQGQRAAPSSMKWTIQQTGSKDSSHIPSRMQSAALITMLST